MTIPKLINIQMGKGNFDRKKKQAETENQDSKGPKEKKDFKDKKDFKHKKDFKDKKHFKSKGSKDSVFPRRKKSDR